MADIKTLWRVLREAIKAFRWSLTSGISPLYALDAIAARDKMRIEARCLGLADQDADEILLQEAERDGWKLTQAARERAHNRLVMKATGGIPPQEILP